MRRGGWPLDLRRYVKFIAAASIFTLVLDCTAFGEAGCESATELRALYGFTYLFASEELRERFYGVDLVDGDVYCLAEIPGFSVKAVAVDGEWETAVALGFLETEGRDYVPYAVLYRAGAQVPYYLFKLPDDGGYFTSMSVVYDQSENVFYFSYCRVGGSGYDESAGRRNYEAICYRWESEKRNPDEFTRVNRVVELVGAPGGNKLYITYIEDTSEFPWQKLFGYLDKETGEYLRLPFEPPGRTYPGDVKWTRSVPYPPGEEREGPIYYFYQSEAPHMDGGYTDVYVRDPENTSAYRHLRIDYSVIDLWYSYEEDVLVYIDHFGEEPRAPKIVVVDLKTGERKLLFLPVSLPSEAFPSPSFDLLYFQ
jgi:hypothetical protein